MWVPGETINKDVYAVNTGSVAAFVKETVSGKLTVEYEDTVIDFDNSASDPYKDKYVELSDEEVTLLMAGGYLIWNNAGATNGPVGTDYEPAAAGDYVFRRAINSNDPLAMQNEKYTLEGYYFDGNKYYKTRIKNYKTGAEANQRTAVSVDADGNLVNVPEIVYVVSDTKTAQPVSFTYEEKTASNPNRLVATYALSDTAAANYDANALAAMHAVKVENAKGEYEFAKYREDVADAEFDLLNDLIDERNTLAAAAKAARDAVGSQGTAASELQSAYDAVTTWNTSGTPKPAVTLNSGDTAYASRVFKSDDAAYLGTGTSNDYQQYPEKLRDAIVAFEKLYGKDLSSGTVDGTVEKEADLIQKVTDLVSAVTTDKDDATNKTFTGVSGINAKIADLEAAYDALDEYSDNLYKAYFDIVKNQNTPTSLDVSNALTAYKTALDGYRTTVDNWKTYVDSLIEKVEDYKTAKTNSVDSDSTAGSKLKDFVDAVGNYKTNVAGATTGLMDSFYKSGATTEDLSKLYSDFHALNMANHDGQDDYNSTTGGQKFQNDVKTAGNENYYIGAAISTDLSTFVENDPTTWTGAKTLANTIGGYTLEVDDVTEDEFVIHNTTLDSTSNSTLAKLRTATANQKAAYERLRDNVQGTSQVGDIKIYVNLDDNVATNWTMDKTKDELNNALTPAADRQAVDFYYNYILDSGETSAKLIDSVTLDESMQNLFKNFTFDLDVTLDSAQINYAGDQETILTTVADNNAAFVLKPTLTNDKDIDTALTWAEATAASTSYSVNGDVVGKPASITTRTVSNSADSSLDGEYKYKVTYMGNDYYGKTETGKFYTMTGSSDADYAVAAASEITVSAT